MNLETVQFGFNLELNYESQIYEFIPPKKLVSISTNHDRTTAVTEDGMKMVARRVESNLGKLYNDINTMIDRHLYKLALINNPISAISAEQCFKFLSIMQDERAKHIIEYPERFI